MAGIKKITEQESDLLLKIEEEEHTVAEPAKKTTVKKSAKKKKKPTKKKPAKKKEPAVKEKKPTKKELAAAEKEHKAKEREAKKKLQAEKAKRAQKLVPAKLENTSYLMEKYHLSYQAARFVELYNGNAVQTAILAGYSRGVANSRSSTILRQENVMQALHDRDYREKSRAIASRRERQAFWTAIMRNPVYPLIYRLKASQLLGQSEGDFVERFEDVGAGSNRTVNVVFRTKPADDDLRRRVLDADTTQEVV